MDTLSNIKAFIQVVEAGSFALAAERLNISRAMVSKHVQNLEDRLGVRLLNRTTRRLSLTEAGTAYYERCGAVLDALDEADLAAAQLAFTPKGTLKVNPPVAFGTRHLYPAIAEYLRTYPEVKLDLTLEDQVVDLVKDGVDMALRIGQLADSSLVARRLAPARLAVCGSPAYFSKWGVPRTPEELKRHNCLGYAYTEFPETWRFTGRDGEHAIQISGNMRANNGEVLRAAAIDGLGVALQPTFIVGDDIKAGTLQAVLTNYAPEEISIYAVYPSRRHLSAKLRMFIDFLTTRFGPEPYWDEWQQAAKK